MRSRPGSRGGIPLLERAQYFSGLIVKVAQERDKSAFVELFDHFAPRLKGFLMKQGAEEALAEEIAQDVMVTLWRKADLFDPSKSSASTWLYRVARNRRIDRLRRQRSAELDPDEPSLQPTPLPDVAEEMDARLREDRVRAALEKLPAEQQDVVRMAFFSGLSHSEIAENSGLPLGTVKSRIRLAFSRLRHLIEADEAIDVD
ncbi:sigma-70 family RNA polymerase sigma factor [Rhodobacterales bacterium]|nr:sigma-70 family RNA polymerase sigma factor [Rhodobacterales bacterium]